MADIIIGKDSKGQEYALTKIGAYPKKFGNGFTLIFKLPSDVSGIDYKIFVDTQTPEYAKVYKVKIKEEEDNF